jgi:hypothetical protein
MEQELELKIQQSDNQRLRSEFDDKIADLELQKSRL